MEKKSLSVFDELSFLINVFKTALLLIYINVLFCCQYYHVNPENTRTEHEWKVFVMIIREVFRKYINISDYLLKRRERVF